MWMREYNAALAPWLKLPDSLRICQRALEYGYTDVRFTILDIAKSNWQSLAYGAQVASRERVHGAHDQI